MKQLICLFLCAICLFSMAACAGSDPEVTATEPETTGTVYPQIVDRLSWDKINALPVKTGSMTVEEMRQLCVDFMYLSKTALWTPSEEHSFIRSNSGEKDVLEMGTVYGGMPYVGTQGCGNVYRMMDYYDPETGVLQIKQAASPIRLFGNHCSGTVYWAWARVINSFTYGPTANLTHVNGCLRVGPYTYSDDVFKFTGESGTSAICEENGQQVMYQSYAKLLPADGLVFNNGSGHVVMCSEAAHVEYTGTGEIDGAKSYVIIMQQSGAWNEQTNSSGDKYQMKSSVNSKWTFESLFKRSYLPFTFAEFLGTDPVEDTQCEYSFTGDVITVKEMFSATVESNYGISDIYTVVRNAAGEEVYRHAMRSNTLDCKGLRIQEKSSFTDSWGTLDVSSGDFTVEVLCQLSTGERPTVYTGKLVP